MIKSVYTFTFRKFLSVFILTFFVKFGFGQVYQSMPQYGYGPVKRFDVDSTLTIPTVCGVPTLKTNLVRKSAIAFDTCNNRFYFYNSKTLVWDTIKSGGGSTDTTSLSNRINLKLNISDTGNMLLPYLRKIDTTNKWVNSVTKVNDSTIRVVKGTTTTDIVINPQATRLITEVYNKTGVQINKGAVVYIDGKHSNNQPSIALAEGNNEANSYKTFALVADNIPNMSSGYVIQAGTITGLNLPTNTYTDGDILYLSPTTAGGYTTTKPLAPNHIVKLGSVVNAHPTQGRIEVKIENGWQLDELSDVQIASVPADSTLLQFSRVDSLWHDVSPTTAIGNRYIKPSDTTTMLNKYLRRTDTTAMLSPYQRSISAVKYSDTTSLIATKTNLLSELNLSDTASMLSPYQRRSINSYSFSANNTNTFANVTNNAFKDSSGTYSGTITFSGTAPSGTTNHTFRYTQIGKMCILNINLSYTTAASCLSVTLTLPSYCATPTDPGGMGANGEFVYPGYGMTWSTKSIPTGTGLNSARTCWLRKNASGVYEMVIFNYSSASTIFLSGTVIYYTN